MRYAILIHDPADDVGVAVRDLKAGEEVGAVTLEGCDMGGLKAAEDILLGHKVALREIPEKKPVIEYGRPIGRATKPVAKGSHVHVHNLKSLRW